MDFQDFGPSEWAFLLDFLTELEGRLDALLGS